MKTIFTFYEKIPTWNHTEIVGIWKRNWQRKGYRPMIIGRDAAKRHPRFGEFVKKVRSFPTINDPRYEEACYIRWLGFSVMLDAVADGRALMSDYDVFNQHFDDSHFGSEDVRCHELTRVPCLVEATKKGARQIIDFIMSRDPDHATGHYSDMIAFKESDWPITGHCQELGEVRGYCKWEDAPAVHVASGAVQRAIPGADKTNFIRGYVK